MPAPHTLDLGTVALTPRSKIARCGRCSRSRKNANQIPPPDPENGPAKPGCDSVTVVMVENDRPTTALRR
jgi:hypothetical protein